MSIKEDNDFRTTIYTRTCSLNRCYSLYVVGGDGNDVTIGESKLVFS